ncbi:hypothetical protein PHLGIDRAFT_485999 [Phlebiopsis gigantea 11061_1 CR5-6]|uniref:Uncharacterized protein n=1 Tax=Phlebiopsis gigantea (strain 11061_1 CR5-6) TaxID=745531 RepID=A0A0C3NL65_PHLG1|nr:hypothetical protein PHLGIDRAFT_485999 [Phlebiopsis gigantea 11061_1 CR5-6]
MSLLNIIVVETVLLTHSYTMYPGQAGFILFYLQTSIYEVYHVELPTRYNHKGYPCVFNNDSCVTWCMILVLCVLVSLLQVQCGRRLFVLLRLLYITEFE